MFDLKGFRLKLDVKQKEMAMLMGMPLRSYQDIEGGPNPVRDIHVAAAKFAALKIVAREGGADRLDADLQGLVAKVSDAILSKRERVPFSNLPPDIIKKVP